MITPSRLSQKLSSLTERYNPVNCHWDVTSRCNAFCPYCFAKDNSRTDLPTDSMLKIADKLSEESVFDICISGGEPFIRKDILVILQRIFDRNFFSTSVYTNGLLLNTEHFKFLEKNAKYIHNFQFSIFSLKPEINDKYFGVRNAFKKIMFSANTLRDSGIPVTIALNVMDFNVSEIRKTESFFRDQGFSVRIGLFKLVSPGNLRNIPDSFSQTSFYKKYLENIPLKESSKIIDRMKKNISGEKQNHNICRGMKSFIGIGPSGDVFPCPVFKSLKLGNILSDNRSLKRMQKDSPEFVSIHDMTKLDIPDCRECQFSGFCQICVAAADMENRTHLKPHTQRCLFAKAVYKKYCEVYGEDKNALTTNSESSA